MLCCGFIVVHTKSDKTIFAAFFKSIGQETCTMYEHDVKSERERFAGVDDPFTLLRYLTSEVRKTRSSTSIL